MGKKNSKLKQDTIDRLTTDTYCKYAWLAWKRLALTWNIFLQLPKKRSDSGTKDFLKIARMACLRNK